MIVNLVNRQINIIPSKGVVTLLHSGHFPTLPRFIAILHSTWHLVHNQPPVQAKAFQVLGHSGKDMTSTKVVVVGLKCSPHHSVQDKHHHLQMHQTRLQHHWETIHSICQHLPALQLHLDQLLAHLGDPPLATQWDNSSCQHNHGKLMLQGFWTYLHLRSSHTKNMLQVTRQTIRRTWVVQRANPHSGYCKPNYSGSNFPKDRAGQLQCVQQVEESMGDWVYEEKLLV